MRYGLQKLGHILKMTSFLGVMATRFYSFTYLTYRRYVGVAIRSRVVANSNSNRLPNQCSKQVNNFVFNARQLAQSCSKQVV